MTTYDARVSVRADGALRTFNEAEVLDVADVQVALRLGELGGESDAEVLLAAAFAVRAVRGGSVALRLSHVRDTVEGGDELPWPEPESWAAGVAGSPLAAAGGPLRVHDGTVWLDRYWRLEELVAEQLVRRAAVVPSYDEAALRDALARLWPGTAPAEQRAAAAVCATATVSVLGGGPGTGKTTTVSRLLAAIRTSSSQPRVALAAPTAKAAARLVESLGEAVTSSPELTDDERDWLRGLPASTLHRLLGLRRGTSRARYGPDEPLPYDVVVVDEASMLSLSLFARLLQALRPTCRLVLVGDPDQLTAVEAGAVLADLVEPSVERGRSAACAERVRGLVPHDDVPSTGDVPAGLGDGVVLLTQVHRQTGALDDLTKAIKGGRPSDVLDVLRSGAPELRFFDVPDDVRVSGDALAVVRELVLDHLAALRDPAAALVALDRHRLLCAHHTGYRGVDEWSALVRRWVGERFGETIRRDGWFFGCPLLVTENDYDNDLLNGDTGVVVRRDGELVAAFPRLGDDPRLLPLGRLGAARPMHAVTVHRSQGSQFDAVTVVLPPASSPLGTRETLYTAVSRAQKSLVVIGSTEAVERAVDRRSERATGLRRRLFEEGG